MQSQALKSGLNRVGHQFYFRRVALPHLIFNKPEKGDLARKIFGIACRNSKPAIILDLIQALRIAHHPGNMFLPVRKCGLKVFGGVRFYLIKAHALFTQTLKMLFFFKKTVQNQGRRG